MGDNQNNQNNQDGIVVEEAFERLSEINKCLEDTNIGLKESMDLYAEGVKLVSLCKSALEGVEKEIQILNEV